MQDQLTDIPERITLIVTGHFPQPGTAPCHKCQGDDSHPALRSQPMRTVSILMTNGDGGNAGGVMHLCEYCLGSMESSANDFAARMENPPFRIVSDQSIQSVTSGPSISVAKIGEEWFLGETRNRVKYGGGAATTYGEFVQLAGPYESLDVAVQEAMKLERVKFAEVAQKISDHAGRAMRAAGLDDDADEVAKVLSFAGSSEVN